MPLTDPQKDYLRWLTAPPGTVPPICLFEGDTGCGKTFIVAMGMLGHSLPYIDEAYLVAGTSVGVVQRNVEPELRSAANMLGLNSKPVRSRSELHIGNNIFYEMGAPNSAASRSVRGVNAVCASLDEATLVQKAFFEELLGRCRTQEDIRVSLTFNPDHPSSWLKRDFIDKDDPSMCKYIVGKLKESCEKGIIPWSYYENLDRTLTGARRKRFLESIWAAEEGQCFPSMEVYPQIGPPYTQIEVGVDFGVSNPCAAVFFGQPLSHPGVWETVGEYYYENKDRTSADHATAIAEYAAHFTPVPTIFRVDPTAKDLRIEMNRRGLHAVRARSAVVAGINAVEDMCKAPLHLLHITEAAPNLIREYPAYVWDPLAPQDKPIKKDDHACDATRYWCYSRSSGWDVLLASDDPDDEGAYDNPLSRLVVPSEPSSLLPSPPTSKISSFDVALTGVPNG